MENFFAKANYFATLEMLEQIVVSQIFEAVSKFEKQYGKECSSFSQEEIQQFADSFAKATGAQSQKVIQMVSAYQKWYKSAKPYLEDPVSYKKFVDNNRDLEKLSKKRWKLDKSIYISDEEIHKYVDMLSSIYDKMLVLAIYEGLDFNDDLEITLQLTIDNCNMKKNTVLYPDGTWVNVSQQLMDLLVQGAIDYEFFPIATLPSDKRCFKRFRIDTDKEDLQAQVRRTLYNIRETYQLPKVKKGPLRCSGYVNALMKAGVKKDFNSRRSLKTPEQKAIAKKYKMDRGANGNYNRTINSIMEEAE